MLFSNLVTDLSANSARVSACNDSICFGQNWDVLGFPGAMNTGKNKKMEIQRSTHKLRQHHSSASHHGERWQLAQHKNPETTSDYS